MTAKKNPYPLFIIFLLGSFICFLAWSAMQAANSGPQVTDADYYSKGLRYTSTLLEKKAASVLGWSVSTDLTGQMLKFNLSDKAGDPVRSAKGSIEIYLPGSEATVKFPLQETEPGIYLLHLTESMTGELNARLEFEQNGARLNRHLLLSL